MDNKFARQHAAAFGKPSLKRRLENFYRAVSPDTIADEAEWRTRFDQIWLKFGGSLEGETKLAAKLEKKYGAKLEVAYHLARPNPSSSEISSSRMRKDQQVDESTFKLTEDETGSGICDFLSRSFDPEAALRNRSKTRRSNESILKHASILDRVDQFTAFLPTSDPMYRPPPRTVHPEDTGNAPNTNRPVPYLERMVEAYKEKGPMRLLFEAAFGKRKKLCVTTRYTNGVRGTLTGTLIGFDKHMNLFLKDARETYTARVIDDPEQTNLEKEKARREKNGLGGFLRHRTVKNMMVRGDTIIACYIAGESDATLTASERQRRENKSKQKKS